MNLQTRFSACIWCGREFTLKGFSAESDRKLGRVKRSEEHIIPESLFGSIISTDVCKSCNDNFGHSVDTALLKDGSVCDAAKRIGIKLTDLLARLEGQQRTAGGRQLKTKIRNGISQIRPEFSAKTFMIHMADGKLRGGDATNAKKFLFQIIKPNLTNNLSDQQIRTEIDKLFADMEHDPRKEVFNPIIRHGLRSEHVDNKIFVNWIYHPWETQWAIAKMAYEFSKMLWPEDYLRYCSPILEKFRKFAIEQKPGIEIFDHTTATTEPNQSHEVTCDLSPNKLKWNIAIFGTARWCYQTSFVRHLKSPKRAYRLEIQNPCPGSTHSAKINLADASV